MGTFGNEFWNVLGTGDPRFMSGEIAAARADGRDTRRELKAIIDAASRAAFTGANPGGIVYFPEGTRVRPGPRLPDRIHRES